MWEANSDDSHLTISFQLKKKEAKTEVNVYKEISWKILVRMDVKEECIIKWMIRTQKYSNPVVKWK